MRWTILAGTHCIIHCYDKNVTTVIRMCFNNILELEDSNVPPDPSYNYLKDPSRENAEYNQEIPKQSNVRRFKHNNFENKWRKDRDHQDSYASDQSKEKDIENPLNIKVEFSTSTGEHVYTIDESTVLPKIKHVPDHVLPPNRPFRARGRGRGRGQQRNYQTRTIRSSRPMPRNREAGDAIVKQEPPPVSLASDENWDEELNENVETSEHQLEYEDHLEGGEEEEDEHFHEVDEESLKAENEHELTASDTKIDGLDKQVEKLNLDENLDKQVEKVNLDESEGSSVKRDEEVDK